jgi:hypothetical protein
MAIEPEKPKLSLQSGANLTQLKKDVKKIVDGINGQKNKRADINAQIASYRAKLETMGIHKKAADMAMAYMGWEPEKREGFDIAYAIVREAMGLPVSDDLFSHADGEVTDALDVALRAGFKTDIIAFLTKIVQQDEAEKAFKGDQVQSATDREAGEGAAILEGVGQVGDSGDDFDKTAPVSAEAQPKPAIGEDAPPAKSAKPGKMAPVVDDRR